MKDLKPAHNILPRLGLLGGTFDPIHRGHLQVAEDVLCQFGLDQVLIIPCALPPHKSDSAPRRNLLTTLHAPLMEQ